MNRSSSAARNGVLCLLANAKPRHFVTGTAISVVKNHFSNLKDPNAHHIFPRSYLKKTLKRPVEEVQLVPNFCFIPADLNRKIDDRPPSDYFAEFKGETGGNPNFEDALRSHLIPSGPDSPIWKNDYDEFLSQRAEMIWASILTVSGEGDIYTSGVAVPRDQARLAVDEVEVKLRRIVHDVLYSHGGGDYWKRVVPGDVQGTVKKKIAEQYKSRVATRIDDPLVRLQYADIMDYHKIIDANWEWFSPRFGSREDLKSHFLALKRYRNPLGHVREMDPIDRKRGEAAVLWFRKTLGASAIVEGQYEDAGDAPSGI